MTLRTETDYEDLLSLWADLETGLGVLLSHPRGVQEFVLRVHQYERWARDLLAQDTDTGLYLLFQLASNSSVGYSTSHALTCAVLCHLVGSELGLAPAERDSLGHAALTMNIGMTALQDELALQSAPLNPEQQQAVREHPARGRALLQDMGVTDALWLDVVARHHTEASPLQTEPAPAQRLAHILQVVDRYAAMISPRKSRVGRSATESMRAILGNAAAYDDEIGHALVRAVGVCPPGTYVRLDDGSLAVVMQRSSQPGLPNVAVVADADDQALAQPRLHRTAERRPRVQSALASASVRLRLNHHRVLQLAAVN